MVSIQTIGGWQLGERLGAGDTASVWRARKRGKKDEGAFRLLEVAHPDEADAVRREFRALERLRHPGLVRIIDSGLDDGRPWLAMEHLPGPTLREWARQTWPPREGDTETALRTLLTTFRDLALTLAWLHGEGECHGDLEPGDVILRDGLVPVIADYDFKARAQRAAGHSSHMRPADDIRALGRMLGWALTGRAVPDGERHDTVAPGVPPSLLVFALMLARVPGDRNALRVSADLADMAQIGAHPESAPRPRSRLMPVSLDQPVEEIVAGALGGQLPPAGFVTFLRARAGGEPLFALEWMRAAVAAGVLQQDARGAWQLIGHEELPNDEASYARVPLPEGARALVQRRLRALSAAALSVAEGAAVLGDPCERSHIVALSKHGREATDALLRELQREDVLEHAGPGLLRFTHPAIREVIDAALAKQRRRELHAWAAQVLEALPAPDPVKVAEHWRVAREPARAAKWYREAAEAAMAVGNREEARQHLKAWKECVAAFRAGPEPRG